MSIASILSAHEVFKLLSREEVSRVSELSSVKSFRKGETIYRKDTPTSHFFVVLEGSVLLQLPATPERQGLAVSRSRKGELIGIAPVLGFERYTVQAVAENEVTLLAIEARPLLALLEANPLAWSGMLSGVARAYYARYLGLLDILQGIASQLTLR